MPDERPVDAIRGQINATLEDCNGDLKNAAFILQMPYETLKRHLREDKALNCRWGTQNPPSRDIPEPDADSTFSRNLGEKLITLPDEVIDELPISVEDEENAKQYVKENRKLLKKGLDGLGLSKRGSEIAIALQQFHEDSFTQQVQIMGSGMTRTTIQLFEFFDGTLERLQAVRAVLGDYGELQNEDREKWVREERMLSKQLTETADIIRACNETSMKNFSLAALIASRTKEKKQAKPGYIAHSPEAELETA